MKAIINGTEVTGTPEEIQKFMKMKGQERTNSQRSFFEKFIGVDPAIGQDTVKVQVVKVDSSIGKSVAQLIADKDTPNNIPNAGDTKTAQEPKFIDINLDPIGFGHMKNIEVISKEHSDAFRTLTIHAKCHCELCYSTGKHTRITLKLEG